MKLFMFTKKYKKSNRQTARLGDLLSMCFERDESSESLANYIFELICL